MNVIRQPKAKPEAPKIQMPRNETPPRVVALAGEPLRFHVDSAKAGQPPYLVDIESGECGCDQWQFRCRPVLEDKTGTLVGPIRCKHLNAAREFFLDQQLRWVAEQANARRVPAYVADRSVSGEQGND